jgi:choice-of-anchor B domain-containing protein
MPKNLIKPFFTALLLLLIHLSSVSAQKNMELLGALPYNECLSNIWGYVGNNNIEYALVGTCSGTSIVSLIDPAQPTEVAFVADATSIWHEIKTWSHYSYTVNEQGNGMTIIDLANLPASVQSYTWNGNGDPLLDGETIETSHTIFIDEKGWCYLFGTNIGEGGAIVLDLAANPINPPIIGMFDNWYIHDGMARGDTLWAAHIYDGFATAVDMSDPMNPQVMAQWNTPNNFSHNIWISDDGDYVFTTDEVDGAYVAAYDVSDLSDVKEIDRVQSSPGMQVIPHNTYYLNGFLPTSYYKDGVAVFDALLPNTLVEVANYDTSPFPSSGGFNGAWGVYPYLPSGRILVSDMEAGLFVVMPTYIHACYVQGTVINAETNTPIPNASVTLNGTEIDLSDFGGNYSLGIADSGSYTLSVNLTGYEPFSTTVNVDNGQILPFIIALQPTPPITLHIQANDANGQPLPNIAVNIQNNDLTFNTTTDPTGLATIENFSVGTYYVIMGAWGYVTQGSEVAINADNTNLTYTLPIGYYDDFALDFGWTVNGNAATGQWERGEPNGTEFDGNPLAPDFDVDSDISNMCYITGNGIGAANEFDVDNGNTRLVSPVCNLSGYADPHLAFHYWFLDVGGQGAAPNDKLLVRINNGISEAIVLEVPSNNPFASTWHYADIRIADFITPTSNMTFSFETSDAQATGHLVEAGIDVFNIYDSVVIGINEPTQNSPSVQVYPNPCSDHLYINMPNDIAINNTILKLYDTTGRLMQSNSLTTSNNLVSLQNLPQGVYKYTLYNNATSKEINSGKIVKIAP